MASPAELLLMACAMGAAALGIAAATRADRRVKSGALAVLLVASSASAMVLRHPAEPTAPPSLPRSTGADSPYVTSDACRGCHPSEHASFSRTFHRTMTQAASARTVLAPLDGSSGLVRRGDEVWANTAAGARRLVLTTGSHREQAFWIEGTRHGDLELLPFVWMIRERRIVPRRDAFLTPPDAPLPRTHWSSNCIACHAVAGEPRHDPVHDAFDTRVAELGIACEACHGPGAAHVERHRDPFERYMQHASKRPDPTMVNPARLPPERSAAVCGQCHSYAYPRDEDDWWTHGYARSFRAGDALEPSRQLLGPDALGKPGAPRIEAAVDSLFWKDGSIRVGGREYNGLVASPCFVKGEGPRKMTCISCHSMHEGDPAGQLAPARTGDRACTNCHAEDQAHTHHASGSPGAECVSCHMPKTSFALLSAVRSHRIDSPSAGATIATGRPNACNLCHLDQSLAWTVRWLAEWYRAPVPSLEARRADVPEGIYGALAGDAAVRVLVADAYGSSGAIAASGRAYAAGILAELVRDPYAAVRFAAERSLRTVPDGQRELGVDRALDPALVQSLLAARDGRAITISE